ncbi:uncharacterized protein LOC112524286 [Cynara cardunculus var. scolymus]|uniref:uncharacterized protein LOC112524286 n=1 Tax=Cynara cardunculus var. scolymus TaxID=59895 RepID=UPI000D625C25|nr:uncharacterized protein LOC112524286 [Cynara cardunculus var. scolymus]
MDKVCALENLFIEKINDLETELESNEIELKRKGRALLSELGTMEVTVKLIQDTMKLNCYLVVALLMLTGIGKAGPIMISGTEKQALIMKLVEQLLQKLQVYRIWSTDELWYDSATILESDSGDEDFHSVLNDVQSLDGSEGVSWPNIEVHRSSVHPEDMAFQSRCDTSFEKRSLSSSPSTTRKKAAHKLSFKWKNGHPNATTVSSKMHIQRPIAGSQVPFCPIEKKMLDSWSYIEPQTFRVRGKNYLRDKKKEHASNYAAYYPFGVDVFSSQRKIDHIARFVELPSVGSVSAEVPSILVVNVQIPLYPAAFFRGEIDGEGISFVLYFKLSDGYSKELSSQFQDNMRRILDDELERVKGFPVDTLIPCRERLKILGHVVNIDDLQLNAPERKLMHAYNGKPVLSRPQHEFYQGKNYIEIDLDMHRFSCISRKGFEAFQDRLKDCILDFGLTIQGNKPEELPEEILCGVRLNGIDYKNYHMLGLNQEPSSP